MTWELRHAETDADLRACFPVMQDLRPHLTSPEEFITRVRRQQQDSYRLLAAWRGEEAIGLAGYRTVENLIRGRYCYVDDLVVRPDERRGGLGRQLLDGVAAEARAAGLNVLALDTAIDNFLGQRFYFRYGMLPAAKRFVIRLD
jgi:ribosomal protein S18 acetylase RimI-like enzyme